MGDEDLTVRNGGEDSGVDLLHEQLHSFVIFEFRGQGCRKGCLMFSLPASVLGWFKKYSLQLLKVGIAMMDG